MVAVGWRVGVGGVEFWARVWVLNKETRLTLSERSRRNERSVNRHFFQRYSPFSSEGLKKFPASCKPASHLVRVCTVCEFLFEMNGFLYKIKANPAFHLVKLRRDKKAISFSYVYFNNSRNLRPFSRGRGNYAG